MVSSSSPLILLHPVSLTTLSKWLVSSSLASPRINSHLTWSVNVLLTRPEGRWFSSCSPLAVRTFPFRNGNVPTCRCTDWSLLWLLEHHWTNVLSLSKADFPLFEGNSVALHWHPFYVNLTGTWGVSENESSQLWSEGKEEMIENRLLIYLVNEQMFLDCWHVSDTTLCARELAQSKTDTACPQGARVVNSIEK